MKALLMTVAAALLIFCSCDDDTGADCDRNAMIELMVVDSYCNDADYLDDNGYVDYGECFDNESRAVVLSIMSCKGREGTAP
ncbi:MAG: hypothetical protein JXA07_15845 [Spirochaetes bacterium]|nr:hypothetical protein [Spirochaetota bacterium]